MQGQLALARLEQCNLIIYTLKGILVVPVKFDKELWDKMVEKLSKFFLEHMVPEILSGKILEEVTHTWVTIQALSIIKSIYTLTRCKIVLMTCLQVREYTCFFACCTVLNSRNIWQYFKIYCKHDGSDCGITSLFRFGKLVLSSVDEFQKTSFLCELNQQF